MTFIGHRVDAAILRFDPALGDHQMFAIVGVRFFVVVIVDADAVWGNEEQQVCVRMRTGMARVECVKWTHLSLLRTNTLEGKMMYCTKQGNSMPTWSRIVNSITRLTMPQSL